MKKLITVLFLVAAIKSNAQSTLLSKTSFSFRYFGFTIHPFGDQTASIQKYKLDDKARFVGNFGGFVSADHYIYKDLVCVTVMQAFFTDCSAGWAGFSHIGIRGLVLDKGKHRIMLGAGPMIYYREDWNRFEEYNDKGSFNRYHSRSLGDVQWRIFPMSGEFAYHYRICEHVDLNAGFTPGLPLALCFSAGVTWWPKRIERQESEIKVYKPKKKKKKE
jgi:hypothetical protein